MTEPYLQGFFKVAEDFGVNPLWLIKQASLPYEKLKTLRPLLEKIMADPGYAANPIEANIVKAITTDANPRELKKILGPGYNFMALKKSLQRRARNLKGISTALVPATTALAPTTPTAVKSMRGIPEIIKYPGAQMNPNFYRNFPLALSNGGSVARRTGATIGRGGAQQAVGIGGTPRAAGGGMGGGGGGVPPPSSGASIGGAGGASRAGVDGGALVPKGLDEGIAEKLTNRSALNKFINAPNTRILGNMLKDPRLALAGLVGLGGGAASRLAGGDKQQGALVGGAAGGTAGLTYGGLKVKQLLDVSRKGGLTSLPKGGKGKIGLLLAAPTLLAGGFGALSGGLLGKKKEPPTVWEKIKSMFS
jgi:hypothetical protein